MSDDVQTAEIENSVGQMVRATCDGNRVELTIGGYLAVVASWNGARIDCIAELGVDGNETDAIFESLERQLRGEGAA